MALRLIKRGLTTCALFFIGAAPGQAQTHRFEVRDSIEMTTFSDPAQIEHLPKINFSPDGSKFLIVTSRGNLASNHIISELSIYDVNSIHRYLRSTQAMPVPSPRRLASLSAIPRGYASRPYAALITELHWSADSRSVYFLGEQSDGSRTLYQVGLPHGGLRSVSPLHVDVRTFCVNRGDEVLFLGEERAGGNRSGSVLDGVPLHGTAHEIIGLPLQQVLFPNLENGVRPREDSLWLVSGGKPPKILARNAALGGPSIDTVSSRWIAVSPDGHYAICILPVSSTASSWGEYDPLPAFEQRRIKPDDSAEVSPFNFNRIRSYFLIDLRTGLRRALVDAPYAGSFGFTDKGMAVWSKHSTSVMVTNTYLPMISNVSDVQRLPPCAALSVNVASNVQQCLVYTRDQYHGEATKDIVPMHLVGGHFDSDSGVSAVLEFAHNNDGTTLEEHYREGTVGWEKVAENDRLSPVPPLSISVHQAMSEPPTLWAQGTEVREPKPAKELMDPNPQLRRATLGQTRVYRWTDETGRKWEGGLVLPPDYDPLQRYPLVIQTHGFRPEDFLADGRYPTAMAAFPLASAGIAVLQLGYTYDHVLTTQEVDDQLLGYKSAIDQLVLDRIVDRKRVGIIGFSRPAWHVEGALVKAPHLFAAATLADGVDAGYLQYMIFGEGNLGMSGETDRINGGPPFADGLPRWFERVLGFHLDKVVTPIRIEAIGPVSLLSEWEDYSSLRQQGKPVDLVYIPQGQHILQSPLDRLTSQAGNVAWFCFWLLGDASSVHCPAVPSQQENAWKKMREQVRASDRTQTHSGAP